MIKHVGGVSRSCDGALLAVLAAPIAAAGGPRNCTELTGHDVDQVGCYELVWVDGVEVSMTFANVQFKGKVPDKNLGVFYVIGPQTDTPQSEDATFVHDHTVAATPAQNHGNYSVRFARSSSSAPPAASLTAPVCPRFRRSRVLAIFRWPPQ